MLIYVPLNRSCGTFSCALYIYMSFCQLLPGLFHALFLHMSFYQLLSGFFNALFLHMSLCQFFPGFFNALFLHMSLRQLSPRLSSLLFLYMSPKHKETHKKKECSHTETFPLSLCIYFSSFVSSLLSTSAA